jgi:predicted outer membrane repeat protein
MSNLFRKSSNLLLAFLLAVSAAGFLPFHTAHAAVTTLYVDADSTCFLLCGSSWATAYPNLQTALSTATAGTQIWVAEGVYYPGSADRAATFTLKDGVTLYGGFDGTEDRLFQRNTAVNPTILSGDIDRNDTNTDGNFIAETTADIVGSNAYHVLSGGGTDNTAGMDGFIITAGLANGVSSPANQGGGMYNSISSPILTNLTFIGNSATQGGGMAISGGQITLSKLTFVGNTATERGGGMQNYEASVTLTDATFSGNSAPYGGGLVNMESSLTLNKILFEANHTTGDGGGIFIDSLSSPTLTNVTFNNNNALHGGGLYNASDTLSVSKVLFTDNQATGSGGGLNDDGNGSTLTNVTFSGNVSGDRGGGMITSDGSPVLTNVTFMENEAVSGGALYIHNKDAGNPTLINAIMAYSSGGDCVETNSGSLTAASGNNLIMDSAHTCGMTDGTNGNIIGPNPNLGPLQDNGGKTQTHALLTDSLAIDAGNNAACPATDQRGLLRPWDGNGSGGNACDIGAYEAPLPSPVFADVPIGHWAISYIESLYANGITGGCSVAPFNYCPMQNVTRGQMAVFLLKAMYGATYVPPNATGTVFNDIPADYMFAKWIEQLAAEGITGGCGGGNYCPNASVTREQMAVFLLRAEHGNTYIPPAATGVFADVPSDNMFAPWIEQLATEGITGGCGGGKFCPKTIVNRAQMAIFLVGTFNLP